MIEKEGYLTYSAVFAKDTLKKYNHHDHGPLVITLEGDNRPASKIYSLHWQKTTFKMASIDYINDIIGKLLAKFILK